MAVEYVAYGELYLTVSSWLFLVLCQVIHITFNVVYRVVYFTSNDRPLQLTKPVAHLSPQNNSK